MTAQEPLREGEIVTLERTRTDYGRERFERVAGPAVRDADCMRIGVRVLGDPVAHSNGELYPGWTILERRDPEPEWADADAILVRYKGGPTAVYAAGRPSFLPFWTKRAADSDIESIKGLYLRPAND